MKTSAAPVNGYTTDSDVQRPRAVTFLTSIGELPVSLLVLTLGRLLFVPVIIVSFDRAPIVTAAALTLFIVADLYDGVVARELGADDPTRRVLDTLVDRCSIWPVYLAVTLTGFLSPFLLIPFLARDLYCGYWCSRIVRERAVAIRADWLYRSLNLMLAAWIVAAPFLQSDARAALFGAVLMFSSVVAVDLRRSVGLVLNMPDAVRSMVIPAGKLRAMHTREGRAKSAVPLPSA